MKKNFMNFFKVQCNFRSNLKSKFEDILEKAISPQI